MDLSSLQTSHPRVWIQFDEDTEVCIEYIPKDEIIRILEESTTTRWVRHQPVREADSVEADRRLGRRAVKGWRALPDRPGFTVDGQPYPYTPENCDTLMTKWAAFSSFVNRVCIDLQRFVAAEKEETLGK